MEEDQFLWGDLLPVVGLEEDVMVAIELSLG
jgi:hypothetical protein